MNRAISSLIAQEVSANLNRSSWVRKMFDEGIRLRKDYGDKEVFDFSLGNPVIEPPKEFFDGLRNILDSNEPGLHRYMPNAGLESVRTYIANKLSKEVSHKFGPNNIIMTVGAGGGLNVVFKSILNPGDEVLAFAPYFVEYEFYVQNFGARLITAKTLENFQPDLDALERGLSYETKAVLVNSPNNPTGVVYSQESINRVAEVIQAAEKKFGHSIYLISDEPYRELIYDDLKAASVFHAHEHSIMVTSHSKDFGLAGERIGYIAINADMADCRLLHAAMVFANRVLGFVNAPALMQRVLPFLQEVPSSKEAYAELRDLTLKLLSEVGFEFVRPQGAFFVFPKSPIEDDIAFMQKALEHRILIVPGKGFGLPGHFRMSYSVEKSTLENAKERFEALMAELKAEFNH